MTISKITIHVNRFGENKPDLDIDVSLTDMMNMLEYKEGGRPTGLWLFIEGYVKAEQEWIKEHGNNSK